MADGNITKQTGGVSAKQLAKTLRRELLKLKEGAFFGYEDELLIRFNVSRPTLRQAARVLEHAQLLKVRRGPTGGYYATRPDTQSVIDAAALYLHGRGTRLRNLVDAAKGLNPTMIRIAAESKDPRAREELKRELAAYVANDFATLTHAEFLRADVALFRALAAMTGNPPLELVVLMLYECALGASSDRIFEGRPDRVDACARLRASLVQAVLDGDAEAAEMFEARGNDLRRRYLTEDAGKLLRVESG
jgi:DNA-binding FadR family transcriptional regulator